jgi:radical SAM superfamily enzyme YgiQ (UPF0313 family)
MGTRAKTKHASPTTASEPAPPFPANLPPRQFPKLSEIFRFQTHFCRTPHGIPPPIFTIDTLSRTLPFPPAPRLPPLNYIQMPDIILATLNAKYIHAAFGLRYLFANLPQHLQARAQILEFDINQRPLDIIETLLAQHPKIIALGIYIWNANQSLDLVSHLKRLRPSITLILGGPEVSHETHDQPITRLADYTLTGEADQAFADLVQKLLNNQRPLQKVIHSKLPEFSSPSSILHPLFSPSPPPLSLPYHLYTPHDLAHRVVYVEASRGCPFKCEFCLSSLDVPVRNVPLEPFLAAMQDLLNRGLQHFKFVDRTFNLNLNISKSILQFFLDRYREGLFLHFEMIPDRLPEPLRDLIKQFPPGALQFEVGIQTFNEEVSQRISRRQDNDKLADNLTFLRTQTGVHIHTDLIVGLPGETLESFAAGFDRLVALNPQEIQVGILKRLRGTPITRHDQPFQMVYSPTPPYEILQNSTLDFPTMQQMRRFSRFWDLIANSGQFIEATPLLWTPPSHPSSFIPHPSLSPFHQFLRLTDWLYAKLGKQHAIALDRLAQRLFEFLSTDCAHDPTEVAQTMYQDLTRSTPRDAPEFLRPHLANNWRRPRRETVPSLPARQQRHLS